MLVEVEDLVEVGGSVSDDDRDVVEVIGERVGDLASERGVKYDDVAAVAPVSDGDAEHRLCEYCRHGRAIALTTEMLSETSAPGLVCCDEQRR